MKKIIKYVVAATLGLTLVCGSALAGSLDFFKQTANAMVSDLDIRNLPVEVISAFDAKSDPDLKRLVTAGALKFSRSSIADAVYFNGRCVVVVNTDATNQQLSADARRLFSREDFLFFVTVHEIGHCVSKAQQSHELRQLQAGETLTDTFLPSAILKAGADGSLNADLFQRILKSEETELREERYADILASLYTRVKMPNATEFLASIEQTRRDATRRGDRQHDTADSIRAVMKYPNPLDPAQLVALGHQLRM